jgi:hypothetical protein
MKWSSYNRKRINNGPESTHNEWSIRGEVQTFRIFALGTGAAVALTEDSVSYGKMDKNQSGDQKWKKERLIVEWREYVKWRVHNMHKITQLQF